MMQKKRLQKIAPEDDVSSAQILMPTFPPEATIHRLRRQASHERHSKVNDTFFIIANQPVSSNLSNENTCGAEGPAIPRRCTP